MKFKTQEALENLLKTRVKIKKIFLSVQNIHIPSGLVYQTEQKKLLFVKHDSRNEVIYLFLPIINIIENFNSFETNVYIFAVRN